MPVQDPTDQRLTAAAARMREDHGADHERYEMWQQMATLLDHLAELAPYWAEPYAAPFVPIIEAGVRVAAAYDAAGRLSETPESAPVVESHTHPDHPHGSLVEQVHRVITTDQGVDGWVLAEEIVGTIQRRVQRVFEVVDRG